LGGNIQGAAVGKLESAATQRNGPGAEVAEGREINQTGIDGGAAGIGVGALECKCSRANFGQTTQTVVADRIGQNHVVRFGVNRCATGIESQRVRGDIGRGARAKLQRAVVKRDGAKGITPGGGEGQSTAIRQHGTRTGTAAGAEGNGARTNNRAA